MSLLVKLLRRVIVSVGNHFSFPGWALLNSVKAQKQRSQYQKRAVALFLPPELLSLIIAFTCTRSESFGSTDNLFLQRQTERRSLVRFSQVEKSWTAPSQRELWRRISILGQTELGALVSSPLFGKFTTKEIRIVGPSAENSNENYQWITQEDIKLLLDNCKSVRCLTLHLLVISPALLCHPNLSGPFDKSGSGSQKTDRSTAFQNFRGHPIVIFISLFPAHP